MTINFIDATTCAQHMLPDYRPLRVPFCEWLLRQNKANELYLHNILLTHEASLTRECVSNVHKSHLWTRNNSHAISERGYRVHFSVAVGPSLLIGWTIWMTTQHINHPRARHEVAPSEQPTKTNSYRGAAWRSASSCGPEVVISARRSSSAL
jgi:hypothetical protein